MQNKEIIVVNERKTATSLLGLLETDFLAWYRGMPNIRITKIRQDYNPSKSGERLVYAITFEEVNEEPVKPEISKFTPKLPTPGSVHDLSTGSLSQELEKLEALLIFQTLCRTNGHQMSACTLLGIDIQDFVARARRLNAIRNKHISIFSEKQIYDVPEQFRTWVQNNPDLSIVGAYEKLTLSWSKTDMTYIVDLSDPANYEPYLALANNKMYLPDNGTDLVKALEEVETELYRMGLEEFDGVVAPCCRLLRITRQDFYRRVHSLKLTNTLFPKKGV